MAVHIAVIASWQERPGRKPELLAVQRASPAGSRARLPTVWRALAAMMGMPSGLGSVGESAGGIPTRRTGVALAARPRDFANPRRLRGVQDCTPSTPAGRWPRVSCATRRTAKRLADQEGLSKRWSLRTVRTAPRRVAWDRRVCRWHTWRWRRLQGSVCPPSLGRLTVVLACGLRRGPFPSPLPGLRQPLPWRSQGRLLLRPSLAHSQAVDPSSPWTLAIPVGRERVGSDAVPGGGLS
jgi:hypothetical protein